MSIFGEIANDPQKGDTIVLMGGLVIYVVKFPGMRENSPENSEVYCMRTTIHRDEPFTRHAQVDMGFAAWCDLVRYAAVSATRRGATS